MKPIPPDNTMDMPFIGAHLPPDIAQAVGTGRMHPCTHQYWEDTIDAKPVPKVLPQGAEGSVMSAAAGQARSVKQGLIDFKPQPAAKRPLGASLQPNSHGACSSADAAVRKAVEAGVTWSGGAGRGAQAMFRPSSTGEADGGRSKGLSASWNGQAKLNAFLPVSTPTLNDFKPPRPAAANVDGEQDVFDDRHAWWRKASSHRGDGGVSGGREDASSDHVSDSEEGNSNDAHLSASTSAVAGISDGSSVGIGAAVRKGGMLGGWSGLKRFKTANPFARQEPAPGVASKFFGAPAAAKEEETPKCAVQDDASSDDCADEGHDARMSKPGGLWTAAWQAGDKKEADMDNDKDDHAAVGELMQTFSYRATAAPPRASGATAHRYVSDLVLPSRNNSGSSLSRRNSASAGAAANTAGQSSMRTASVGREEIAQGPRGVKTSGCPIEELQYRAAASKIYRPLGEGGGKRASTAGSSPAPHFGSGVGSPANVSTLARGGRGGGFGARGTPRISLAPKGPTSRGAFASSMDALAAFAHTPPTVARGRK